jgi:hypothetical protein
MFDNAGGRRVTAVKSLVSVLDVKREQVWEQIVREDVINLDEGHKVAIRDFRLWPRSG